MSPMRILLAVALVLFFAGRAAADDFEVWLVDQSNSNGLTYGGAIHIYQGSALMGEDAARAQAQTIDLSGATAAMCLANTGANSVRPHMIVFNHADTHAALAFVASGHVVIFDAPTRTPLACFRMSAGAGGARQAHAAWPTPDDKAILVANQNGKLFERIDTDYATRTFTHNTAATLNLATCTTPNGVACQAPRIRPDNAPICPFVATDNGPAFVSLRGGGMFMVDHAATPMAIVGEYDAGAIGPNGCGMIEASGYVFINAGGGTATNLAEFLVYRLPMTGYNTENPPNTPQPEVLFRDDSEHRDAHGVATTRLEQYVWVYDRASNVAEVFDARTGYRVNTVGLLSNDSDDPTPDLVAVAPSGNRMFVSMRGPLPLSGDPHASTGSTPGLGVVQVVQGGRDGWMKAVVRISNVDAAGVERADAHGIRIRRLN